MASHTENINIIYNTNASQVVRPVKSLTGQMKAQQSQVKSLALRFVGYNLILNAVMNMQRKVIEGIWESVKAFREFEYRMAEVSTIMGTETLDQMGKLSAGIEVLSMKFGQGSSDLAKGMYDILSAAFSVKDALSLLSTATRASIAGLSDVRTSVDIFTSVLNAYGKEVSQAAIISDDLFQSVIRGKFQFSELESALGYIVPIAAQAGLEFKELMSALSTATRHGLHLDMTARGLALAIQNIIQPSEGAAEAAEKYGISMDGLTLRVKGLYGWFEELNAKTKEFGRSIIGELIPNMRSVRVAMVLAGDEGLAGFAEDLELIQNAAGATETALGKMMETAQFTANQLDQQLEQVKRNIGEEWNTAILNIQKGILSITGALSYQDSELYKNFMPTDDDIKNIKSYVELSKQADELSKTMSKKIPERGGYSSLEERLEKFEEEKEFKKSRDELKALLDITDQLKPSFDNFFGGIADGMENLGNLEVDLLEIEVRMKSLNEELNKTITTGWGNYQKTIKGTLGLELEQLLVEQRLTDVQHDYEMGLKDSTYTYKVLNTDMQDAIKILREHEEAQKQDRKETELMNIAMRQLNIQIMEIQLRGMMRRRGLTRQEERTIKKLNIEQMKLRLENMKETEEETAETYELYNEKKKMVDEYIAKLEEENYQIRYTYDQEVLDLRNHIDYQKAQLETMVGYWDLTKIQIVDSSTEMIAQLKEIFQDKEFTQILKDFGIDIEKTLEDLKALRVQTSTTVNPGTTRVSSGAKILNTVEENFGVTPATQKIREIHQHLYKNILGRGGFQRGTHFVPETGFYQLHRGETVSPAGNTSVGGDNYQITINMNGAVVRDENDIQRVAKSMGSAIQRNLLDRKSGKSKYRVLP